MIIVFLIKYVRVPSVDSRLVQAHFFFGPFLIGLEGASGAAKMVRNVGDKRKRNRTGAVRPSSASELSEIPLICPHTVRGWVSDQP